MTVVVSNSNSVEYIFGFLKQLLHWAVRVDDHIAKLRFHGCSLQKI